MNKIDLFDNKNMTFNRKNESREETLERLEDKSVKTEKAMFNVLLIIKQVLKKLLQNITNLTMFCDARRK
jgi:hypothetical protein